MNVISYPKNFDEIASSLINQVCEILFFFKNFLKFLLLYS